MYAQGFDPAFTSAAKIDYALGIPLTHLEQLTHGWAVSVHKAQGSAFRRVIVPFARSRLLDRTMVYTAVTRAIDTVVLVGDTALIRQVVQAPSRAHERRVTLSFDQFRD